MEQYLQLAILLFPGYTAKEIACYLGDIGKRQKSSLEEYSFLLCVNPTFWTRVLMKRGRS